MERDASTPGSPRRRYAPWAMTAIVTALIALMLQGSLLPLNIAVAIFAVLGLRQVRRHPRRYIGRPFCWIALALVLVLAILNAMLQPAVREGIPESVPEQRESEAQ